MRCYQCGLESPLDGMFRKKLCPSCKKKRSSILYGIIYALLAVEFVFLAMQGRGYAMQLFGWVLCLYVAVVVHESGHLLGRLVTGVPVWKFTIGRGKLLARRRICGVEFQLRFGLSGSVAGMTLNMRGWRWRRFVCVAFGPLANVGLCLAALHLAGGWGHLPGSVEQIRPFSWEMLAMANGVLFVTNCLYFGNVRTAAGLSQSDTRQMLQLLTKPLPTLSQRQANYYLNLGSILCEGKSYFAAREVFARGVGQLPSNTQLKLGLGQTYLLTGEYETGRAMLRELSSTHTKKDAIRAYVQNNLAWADLMIGGEQKIEEADAASAEAHLLMPWEASIQSTRGLALLERGDVADARPLLQKALQGADRNENKASVLCSLAMAEQRSGNRAQARNYVERARRLDGNCELLARAERELAEMPQQAS